MEIFRRQKRNEIEGINIKEWRKILNGDQSKDDHMIDSIIMDRILLANNQTIKCVKEYYAMSDGRCPKKNGPQSKCASVQRFYGVRCMPYECIDCHLSLLDLRRDKVVVPK